MAKVRLEAWARLLAGGCGLAALAMTVPARAAESEEPPIAGVGKDADYLRLFHEKIHPNWVDGYIRMSAYSDLGPADSQRETEIQVSVRWDGTIEAAKIVKPSDASDFDAAAMNALVMAAPFPPPVEVLADDGLAHIQWRFARDHRLCAGGQLLHVEFPLRVALPNLTARGQLDEAIRRMSDELAHQGWSGGDFITPFARQWLARPTLSTELDTRAAGALAMGGDRQQSHRLEQALLLPAVAPIAARALDSLGANLGGLLAKVLPDGTIDIHSARYAAVLGAIRAVPSAASGCEPCINVLIAGLRDPKQSAGARAQIVELLAKVDRTEAITAVLEQAEKAPDAPIRAAALLANLPAGHSRQGIFRMSSLLHDASPEIRAAATVGVLRAGGEAGLEQLYLIGREKDPRPLVAAAGELAHFTSEASALMLGKLLKRTEKNVRVAAIRALASRHDEPARKLVDPILMNARQNATEDSAVRELVLASAAPEDLARMALDSKLGLSVYRAWLRTNQRQDAARWLVGNLLLLSPEDRIAVLGDWIAVAPNPRDAKVISAGLSDR